MRCLNMFRYPYIYALFLFMIVVPAVGQTLNNDDRTTREPVEISVLFYYLPDSVTQAGSLEQLGLTLDQQIAQANHIFSNSNIPARFVIAAAKPWPFLNDHWSLLRAKAIYQTMGPYVDQLWSAGAFHQVGADALFLVDYRDPEDTHCGWASIDTEASLRDQQSTRAYGVVRLGQGCGTDASVLAHEIGHLLGAAHGHDQALEASSYLGYGVQCAGKATLMHTSFPKHDFVSSPDILVGGEACGYQDAADNRQLFIERAPLLANKVGAPSALSASEPEFTSSASSTVSSTASSSSSSEPSATDASHTDTSKHEALSSERETERTTGEEHDNPALNGTLNHGPLDLNASNSQGGSANTLLILLMMFLMFMRRCLNRV